MKIEVSFIVVHYKNSSLTLKCIAEIEKSLEQSMLLGEIILVDNSQDFNLNLFVDTEKIRVVVNEYNLGFARANNMGILAARGEYLVLLNNDAFMTDKALLAGLKFLQSRKNIGLWAPVLRFEDGRIQKSFSELPTVLQLADEYLFFHFFNRVKKAFGSRAQLDQVLVVQSVIGACWFLSRDTVKKLGLLDGDFFFTSEDTEYCLRIRNAGLYCFIDGRESIIHLGSASQKHRSWSSDPFLHNARSLYFKKFTSAGKLANIIISLGLALRKMAKL